MSGSAATFSGGTVFSAGAVARRLGVAVTTLRTWHQRYGLGPSAHVPGQHRRYTERDVERLEAMHRLITEGVAPGEAARWARGGGFAVGGHLTRHGGGPAAGGDLTGRDGLAVGGDLTRRDGGGLAAGGDLAGLDQGGLSAGADGRDGDGLTVGTGGRNGGGLAVGTGGRDGGGLAVGAGGRAARGLSRAALRLDATAVRERVGSAVRELGVVGAWDSVLRPVLAAVGDRHAATGQLVDVEHLLSGCVSSVLGAVPRPPHGVPVKIMLACADEEQHTLPLEALAAALAAEGVPARMLGARVPTPALISAVRRTGPAALVVWSHAPSTADPAQLRAVLDERARPVVVAAAGPGWHLGDLPPGVANPTTLTDALLLVAAA